MSVPLIVWPPPVKLLQYVPDENSALPPPCHAPIARARVPPGITAQSRRPAAAATIVRPSAEIATVDHGRPRGALFDVVPVVPTLLE